jgi:SAM-dependent methyltransferase
MIEKDWLDRWEKEAHLEKKNLMFNIVDSYLKVPPKNILDIGCGLAFESEMFQKKYNSNLYLLDGDFESTQSRKRKVRYGSSETMAFYSKIEDLQQSWQSRGIKYNFLDANNIILDKSVKFDLIYSFESCGFHYPISTYKDFLKDHIDSNTTFIFDIRKKSLKDQEKDFTIVESLYSNKKYETLSVKLVY